GLPRAPCGGSRSGHRAWPSSLDHPEQRFVGCPLGGGWLSSDGLGQRPLEREKVPEVRGEIERRAQRLGQFLVVLAVLAEVRSCQEVAGVTDRILEDRLDVGPPLIHGAVTLLPIARGARRREVLELVA